MRLNVSDRIHLNRASVCRLRIRRSPICRPSERLHVEADYERYDWRGHATYNKADFYDLVGPTKTGRRGYEVGLGRSMTLIYDEPRRLTLEMDGQPVGQPRSPARLPEYPG
jgi:hypothetical protein